MTSIAPILPEGKLRISRAVKLPRSAKFELHSCLVTFVDSTSDSELRKKYGVSGLRRHKLLRITGEAFEQSVALTQEMLSFDILGCGLRTLHRDIAFFTAQSVFIPFHRQSPGRKKGSYTYRVAAAKQFLQGRSRTEIAVNLYQKVESVEAFIRDFARIVRLASSGIGLAHIGKVTQIPEVLIGEYLQLFKEYNTPQLFTRLDLLAFTAK